jgi:Transposase
MWKPFRLATAAHAPQAAILFDKFHVMRHLGEALDQVRKSEYRRVAGRDRRYIKGQKYTLLSRKENLTLDGKRALKRLLSANKRLNTAYVLKESFGQLWSYEREGWARRFFENWRTGLKWQRLKPYEKFAEMIDRHWDGIAAYCRPENKVSLGFVEGLNNKIRVIQRRAYGLREDPHLHAAGAISLPLFETPRPLGPVTLTTGEQTKSRHPRRWRKSCRWGHVDNAKGVAHMSPAITATTAISIFIPKKYPLDHAKRPLCFCGHPA